MYILDTNTSCLGKSALLKANGVTAVGRYYRKETYPEYKISKAEAQELSKAGISLFIVFEDYGRADKLVLSEEQGIKDATSALQQAKDIGQPAGTAIYFAAEGLPDGYKSSDLPKVRSYFKGIKDKLAGKFAAGVYGDGVVCDTLQNEGLVQYTWLCAASTSFEGTCRSFGKVQWNLAQVPPLDIDWNGLSIDRNIDNPKRSGGDFGAFLVPFSTS